jgi:hypothetical protein
MQDLAAQDAEDAQLSGNGHWVIKRTVITFTASVQIHTPLELKTYGIGFTPVLLRLLARPGLLSREHPAFCTETTKHSLSYTEAVMERRHS